MSGTSSVAGLQPEELEFLAEEYLVRIIPKFTQEQFFCITGDFGRFDTGVPVEVPVWLALRLREESLCTVLPPSWMTIDRLTETLRTEKENIDEFAQLPFYFAEIAWLILSSWAREDIPSAERVGELIEDIEAARKQKVQKGVAQILGVAGSESLPRLIDLTFISAKEVAALRCSFLKALDGIVEAGEMQQDMDRSRRRRADVGASQYESRELSYSDPADYSAVTGGVDTFDAAAAEFSRRSRLRGLLRGARAAPSAAEDSADPGSIPDSTGAEEDHLASSGVMPDEAGERNSEEEAESGRRGERQDGAVKLRRFR